MISEETWDSWAVGGVVPPMPPLSRLLICVEQRYIGRDLGLVGGWGVCPTGSLPSLTLTSRELKP